MAIDASRARLSISALVWAIAALERSISFKIAILKEIERSKAAIAQTNAEIDNLAREASIAMKASEADGSADSSSEPKTPSPNERSTREP